MLCGLALRGKAFPPHPHFYEFTASTLSCDSSSTAAAAPVGTLLVRLRRPTPHRPSSTGYGGGPSLRCVRLRRVCSLLPVSLETCSSLTSAPRRLPRFFHRAALSRRRVVNWWRQRDSNPQHPACKAGALAIELCPQAGSLCPSPRFRR